MSDFGSGNGAEDASRWDMAVIGAGPTGSARAHSALAACANMRVALVDRETFPRDKACGDAVRQEAAVTLGEFGPESFAEAYAERFADMMTDIGLLCVRIRFRKLFVQMALK